MAKNILVGVNNIARKPSYIYVGVDGKARKVKAIYVGVNGIAKQCWPNSRIPDTAYTELEWSGCGCDTLIKADTNPRIIITFGYRSATGDYNDDYLFHGDSYFGSGDNYGYYMYGAELSNGLYINDLYSVNPSGGFQVSYSTSLYEAPLVGPVYRLDYNNNKKTYLYCTSGYYSYSNHNFLYNNNPPSITYNSPNNIVVITDENGGSAQNYADASPLVKVYSIEMLSGSDYLRYLIPAYRNSDKVVGWYDIKDNRFFPSASYYITRTTENSKDYIGPAIG